jgi:hypothetical protein
MREVTDERAIAERREVAVVEEVMDVTGQVQGADALSSTFLHITPFRFSRTPIYFILL